MAARDHSPPKSGTTIEALFIEPGGRPVPRRRAGQLLIDASEMNEAELAAVGTASVYDIQLQW